MKINCVGDSHVNIFTEPDNVFGPKEFPSIKWNIPFISYELGAFTAYNIYKNRNNKSLVKALDQIPEKSLVLLSFGEIDCRVHLCKYIKDRSPEDVVLECVSRYSKFIDYMIGLNFDIVIYNVIPPRPYLDKDISAYNGSFKERLEITILFNKMLDITCIKKGIKVFSLFDEVVSQSIYYYKDNHLNEKAQELFMKKYGYKGQNNKKRPPFYTGVRDVEHQLILKGFENIKNPVYLEIGVNYGGTFVKILEHLKGFGKAYGIDLFENVNKEELNYKIGWPYRTQTHDINGDFGLNTAILSELNQSLKEKGYSNFKLIKGYSHEQIPLIDEIFDVIFIDGNHTYPQTKHDFECCFNKSKIGTYFVFHNTTKKEKENIYQDGGPYQFCEELMKNKTLEYVGIQHTAKAFRRIK